MLDGITPSYTGKVRELYDIDDDHLLMVASDRVSTYDCIHPTPVPDKGRVLTGLSVFWFAHLADVVANHLESVDPGDLPDDFAPHTDELRGRMMLTRRLEMVPFECVVRGYLSGSGWREYQQDGSVCGVRLPAGLVEADRLPEPVFTPATKAAFGDHDENVTFDRMVRDLGQDLATRLRDLSIEVYTRGAAHAADNGIILADTKFEFGLDEHGEVVLADEVMTPDSSRYWPADTWEPGRNPPSYDKQFVRDYATGTGWDRNPPAPALPDEVVAATRAKYVEAYEGLTGRPFDTWMAG